MQLLREVSGERQNLLVVLEWENKHCRKASEWKVTTQTALPSPSDPPSAGQPSGELRGERPNNQTNEYTLCLLPAGRSLPHAQTPTLSYRECTLWPRTFQPQTVPLCPDITATSAAQRLCYAVCFFQTAIPQPAPVTYCAFKKSKHNQVSDHQLPLLSIFRGSQLPQPVLPSYILHLFKMLQ